MNKQGIMVDILTSPTQLSTTLSKSARPRTHLLALFLPPFATIRAILSDDMIKALAAKAGVIQINYENASSTRLQRRCR